MIRWAATLGPWEGLVGPADHLGLFPAQTQEVGVVQLALKVGPRVQGEFPGRSLALKEAERARFPVTQRVLQAAQDSELEGLPLGHFPLVAWASLGPYF